MAIEMKASEQYFPVVVYYGIQAAEASFNC